MSAPVSTMTSPLTSAIRRFVDHKRVLGRRYDTETGALRLFDRYLVEQHITTCAAITPAVIDTFLRSRPRRRPRSFNHLRGVLARFFTWLVSRDLVPASPVRTPTQRGSGSRIPCILSADQVRVLVEEAARLPDAPGTTDRGATYRAIFVVLYALGLRVGEVCRLNVADLDRTRRVLLIRQTKFGKDRLVPFGPWSDSCSSSTSRCAARATRPSATTRPSFLSEEAGGSIGTPSTRSFVGSALTSTS